MIDDEIQGETSLRKILEECLPNHYVLMKPVIDLGDVSGYSPTLSVLAIDVFRVPVLAKEEEDSGEFYEKYHVGRFSALTMNPKALQSEMKFGVN